MLRSAVLQKLIIIGEAAAHLPANFCLQNPRIPWVDMINFRNFAVQEPVSWTPFGGASRRKRVLLLQGFALLTTGAIREENGRFFYGVLREGNG
jgi:hypothetical protein